MDVCIPAAENIGLDLKPLAGICGADLSCTLHCENVVAHTEAKHRWRRLHSPTPSSLEKCMFCLLVVCLFVCCIVVCFGFALEEQPLHGDRACPRGCLCSGGNGRVFLPAKHLTALTGDLAISAACGPPSPGLISRETA